MGANQQKIAALTDKLATLGNKQRGMPIEADDWNSLVAVLQGALEIDRTQDDQQTGQLARNFAPLEHQHLSEVSAPWLAPDLQARFAASGGDTDILLRLNAVEAQLAGINHQLAQLSQLSDAHQTAIDRYGISDLDRAAAVRDLTAKFGTVSGLQTAVNAATSDLAGLKANVQTVLDLRRTLSNPDGTPINVAGLQQSVSDLQKLRDSLKGIDGTPLRLSDLDLRLKDVEDSVGTGAGGGLDARIGAAVSAAETRLKSAQTDAITALRAQMTEETARQIGAGQAAFQQAMDAKLAAAAQTNQAAIDKGLAGLRAETNDHISSSIAAAEQAQTDATKALVAQQMGTVPGLINNALANARTDILKAARDDAATQISSAVQTAVTASEARMTDRLKAAQTQFQQNLSATETRIRADYTAAIGTLRDQTSTMIGTRFTAMQQTMSAAITTQVKNEVAARVPEINAATQAAVDKGLAAQDSRIEQSVANATKTLPDTVASQVKLQIAQLNIAGQISAASAQLTTQYRADLATAISSQQDRTSASINAAITQLRGEVAVARSNATKDAIASTNSMIASVRGEFSAGIASLRTEMQTNLNQATTKLRSDMNARIAAQPATTRTVGGINR